MCENEFSYCDLRAKEVVNACDGKRMGRIVDNLFSREDGTISGIVVPLCKRGMFSKNQDIFIPWRCIQKIGADVILVRLTTDGSGEPICCSEEPREKREHCKPPQENCKPPQDSCKPSKEKCPPPPPPGCDFRCEKCMLFDCAYRWSQTNC